MGDISTTGGANRTAGARGDDAHVDTRVRSRRIGSPTAPTPAAARPVGSVTRGGAEDFKPGHVGRRILRIVTARAAGARRGTRLRVPAPFTPTRNREAQSRRLTIHPFRSCSASREPVKTIDRLTVRRPGEEIEIERRARPSLPTRSARAAAWSCSAAASGRRISGPPRAPTLRSLAQAPPEGGI